VLCRGYVLGSASVTQYAALSVPDVFFGYGGLWSLYFFFSGHFLPTVVFVVGDSEGFFFLVSLVVWFSKLDGISFVVGFGVFVFWVVFFFRFFPGATPEGQLSWFPTFLSFLFRPITCRNDKAPNASLPVIWRSQQVVNERGSSARS